MPQLSHTEFSGHHLDTSTDIVHAYEGTCEVAVDVHGRESLHVRARVVSDGHERTLTTLGFVDHRGSFVGREAEVARAIVERACSLRPMS